MPSTEEFAERLVSLRETRARLPEIVRNRWASRRRRPAATHGARALLIEVDEPARGQLEVRDDVTALADRGEHLRRIVTALEVPGVNGVIGTADILEDLLVLEALEDRLAIGTMNRSTPAGSLFPTDGRFTGYDADTIAGGHLDGGKMDLRIDPSDPITAATVEQCGRAITALAGNGVLALVQPSWVDPAGGSGMPGGAADQIRAVDIASGLGGRSAFTWLAIPLTEHLRAVLGATTLPALLIGEDPSIDTEETHAAWAAALALPGARGMILPSAALYPADGDIAGAVDAVAQMVHGDARAEGARR